MRTLIVFLLLAPPFITAQLVEEAPPFPPGEFTLTLFIKEANTLRPFPGQAVALAVSGDGGELKGVFSTTPASSVSISLDASEWKISGEIDDAATPGKDWTGALAVKIANDSSSALYLQQVASAMGEVLEENRTVSGAQVTLACPGSFHDPALLNGEIRSGEGGAFSIKYLPVGMCKIIASANGKSGSVTVTAKQGEVKEAVIVLGKEAGTQETRWLFLAGIVIIAAAMGAGAWLYFKKTSGLVEKPKKRREEQKVRAPETGLKKTKKMLSVLGSLTDRERQVAEFVLREGGKTTQARIYRALLIPKASLSRVIDSLERRNVIKATAVGKTNELELTQWFAE